MREQARREFAIAGLPHRIQDLENEMERQQKQMQVSEEEEDLSPSLV